MSRYDQPTQEPDYDRYETKPVEDVDVPDFDQPEPIIDPAEHAAQQIVRGLTTIANQVVTADFERLMSLWKIVRELNTECARVVDALGSAVDQIMERRR